MKSRIKGITSRSWRKAARGTSIRDVAPHPERAGCRNKHNNAHGRAHAHARKIRARRVGSGRRRVDRRLRRIRAGAGQGADPDRLPAADHRPARLARRRDGERLPAVLGAGRHDRRRPQGRDRHRRHHLQSGSGADPGAPPRAAGEGALHGRAAVRPRRSGGRAGEQGDRRAAGDGRGRRRQRDQVGPHADRGAHRDFVEPDRPSVRRVSLQGARPAQRDLHRAGLHVRP